MWISPARFYHLPDYVEVAWDPSDAKRPGERFNLSATEVREKVVAGALDRGLESPLRGDTHGGFGERPGERDQQQCRHRAPGRLIRLL